MKTLLKKSKKQNLQFKLVTNRENSNLINYETQKEISKEIIRRLRIQNKKLIERVTKLKEEINRTKNNRIQALNHLNELLKLI